MTLIERRNVFSVPSRGHCGISLLRNYHINVLPFVCVRPSLRVERISIHQVSFGVDVSTWKGYGRLESEMYVATTKLNLAFEKKEMKVSLIGRNRSL
jgi:hypothetical protein